MLTAIALTLSLLTNPVSPQAQSGVITGYIRHEDGRPAVAVRVAAVRESDDEAAGNRPTESVAWTDTAGFYRLGDVPTGRHWIRLGSAYQTVFRVTTSADLSIVDVSPNSRIDLDLMVPNEFEIRGRLQEYLPLEYRHTTISLAGSGLWPSTTLIRPDGSFRFIGVPPGQYRMSVGSSTTDIPVVVEDGDVEGVELVATIHEDLTVRIEAEDSVPIPQQLSLTLSGPEGSFETGRWFQGSVGLSLPQGTYRVATTDVPDHYAVLAVRAGDNDLLTEPLLVDGSTFREIVIRIGPSASEVWHNVQGHVNPTTDQSRPGGFFVLEPAPARIYEPLWVPVRPDGSFEFNVPTGPWDLRNPGGGTVQQRMEVDQNLTDLEIQRAGVVDVSGRVVVEEGLQLPPLAVSFDGGAAARLARTEADGAFSIQLSEGEYEVIVDVQAFFRIRSARFGAVDLQQESLDLVGADSAEVEIVLEPNENVPAMRSVRGRVVDSSNLPTPRLAVLLQSQEAVTFPPRRAEIAADGAFVFENVYPGRYLVRQESFDLAAVEWESVNVVVQDDDVDGVRLVVPPQIMLRGQVVVEDGEPLPPIGMMVGQVHSFSILPVSPDGRFEIPMPPGIHQLVLTRIPNGYALPSMTYGAINAAEEPLVLTGATADELRIVFGNGQ